MKLWIFETTLALKVIESEKAVTEGLPNWLLMALLPNSFAFGKNSASATHGC